MSFIKENNLNKYLQEASNKSLLDAFLLVFYIRDSMSSGDRLIILGAPSSYLKSLEIILSMNYLLDAALGIGMYNLLPRRLLTASSRSFGLFVAPIIRILASSPANVLAPSSYTKNSVFILRLAS